MRKKSNLILLIDHFLLWVPGDPFHTVKLQKYFMHRRVNFKIATFFFEVCFKGGVPTMHTNQIKDTCNEIHFFDKFAG